MSLVERQCVGFVFGRAVHIQIRLPAIRETDQFGRLVERLGTERATDPSGLPGQGIEQVGSRNSGFFMIDCMNAAVVQNQIGGNGAPFGFYGVGRS
ncbi:hypothetical protein [Pseudomonas chlororaphis]|uniref:hypothetical protein n=1 Tax=Pseudomonas chlororaphis TaxID=587753 RepID=UPI00046FC9A5|nr:hypothetical protein [Pseudomonas chlororaphis]